MKSKEIGKALVLGGVSAIPFAGGIISNLIEVYMPESLRNRREVIVDNLEKTIAILEEKTRIDWEVEFKKDETQSTFLKYIKLAEQEHEKEKIQYFQNVFLNSIIIPIDYDRKCVFLNLTSELTSRHIKILKIMNDPPEHLRTKGITLSLTMGGLEHMLERSIEDYTKEKEFYKNIYEDLQNRHLLAKGGFGVTMSLNGILASRTTDFGSQYLKYLGNPQNI